MNYYPRSFQDLLVCLSVDSWFKELRSSVIYSISRNDVLGFWYQQRVVHLGKFEPLLGDEF